MKGVVLEAQVGKQVVAVVGKQDYTEAGVVYRDAGRVAGNMAVLLVEGPGTKQKQCFKKQE